MLCRSLKTGEQGEKEIKVRGTNKEKKQDKTKHFRIERVISFAQHGKVV